MAPAAIDSPLSWHLTASPCFQLASYCYPHSFVFRRTSMVTFQVPDTLYGYDTVPVWGSALYCSALPMMARDLSSHLVLHTGAAGLPSGWAFWACCCPRHFRVR